MADDLKATLLAGIDQAFVSGVQHQFELMTSTIRKQPDATRETFRDGVRARLAARAAARDDIETIFKD